MRFSISSSAFEAALQRHITNTPINEPTKSPIINPNILTPRFCFYLIYPDNRKEHTLSVVGLISIVLSLFILDTLRQGTHQTALHIAPLEFHHREDLPQPPSLVATVLSRSTFDWTEVSLSPLPVIAVIEFAFQCLSPEDI